MGSTQMRTDGAMKNAHYSVWHASEDVTLSATKVALCEAVGCQAEDSMDGAGVEWSLRGRSCRSSVARAEHTRRRSGGVLHAMGALLRAGSRSKRSTCTSGVECDLDEEFHEESLP